MLASWGPETAWAGTLCVVRSGKVPGLEAAAFDAALVMERRKWGIVIDVSERPSLDSCAFPSSDGIRLILFLEPGTVVRIQDSAGTIRPVDLSQTDIRDRAAEVARFVVALMPGPANPARPALLTGPLPQRRMATLAGPLPAAPPPVQGYAEAGGWYAWEGGAGMHTGGISGEVGVSLLDERLLAGLRAGWQPSQAGPGGPASVQSVPVTAVVHGGVRISRILLRLVLEVGLEWRRVVVAPRSRIDPVTAGDTAGVLGGELEVVVPLTPLLRLAIAGTGRGYLRGASFTWNGENVLKAPRYAFGAAVRLGVVFPVAGSGKSGDRDAVGR